LLLVLHAVRSGGVLAAESMERQGPMAPLPRPAHIVMVIEENKSFARIIGNAHAPYINALAERGALFTSSYAITYPSQPNYLALFSGSTHGITSNSCPLRLRGPNLAAALINKGFSFGIYSESMPHTGYTGCFAEGDHYARKHNPAVNWQDDNVPAAVNMTFREFPGDYASLPTVAMVVPNQVNDMHSGQVLEKTIARGDRWLKENLDAYAHWAMTNNSLLIITWDEDDKAAGNHIPTIFYGPMVKPGRYDTPINHYSVLRTLAYMYGFPPPGQAAQALPIQEIWETVKAETTGTR